MNNREARRIVEYANRVQELCYGLEFPEFPPGTPYAIHTDSKREVGSKWLGKAGKLLEDDWRGVRRVLENRAPNSVQRLNHSRTAILAKAIRDPYGFASDLEVRVDRPVPGEDARSSRKPRLVPDAILVPLIERFVQDLHDEVDATNVALRRRVFSFLLSLSLLEKIIAGIIVACITTIVLIPALKAWVPWLKTQAVAPSAQDPNNMQSGEPMPTSLAR